MNDFLSLRRNIIEKEFSRMNDMQKKAVFQANGPLLIIAGAGSGKTTTMVNRIAYLIRFGNAYYSDYVPDYITDEDINELQMYLDGKSDGFFEPDSLLAVDAARPWQILAITFTNKAAGELKDRIALMLGEETAKDVWASTFHSCCAKILRRFGDKLGYSSSFSIYDTDDSKRLIKECQRRLSIDDRMLSHKFIMNKISDAKNYLISPAEYERNADEKRDANPLIAKAYKLYQDELKKADAMDFDDLIFNTVALLENHADVREYYQRKFKYVMVDEYQDTNFAQFRLSQLLADGYGNICVVGDDDQSIYKFRGATIENILGFEKQYTNTKVIRLEQNYRSTQTILDAANAVIARNTERKGKSLWTANGEGEKITVFTAADEKSEAEFIYNTITKNTVFDGAKYSDHAILYRTNAQSNALERQFTGGAVPYRIFGGHRFYERAEIRDAIAYLTVVNNPSDNVRLFRIINIPARGIGQTTINRINDISLATGWPAFDIISNADEFAVLQRSAGKLRAFAAMILRIREGLDEKPVNEILEDVLNETGYIRHLEADTEKGQERKENIGQLLSNLLDYSIENGEEATLQGFLEEVSLLTDIDNYDANSDAVVMMTLHSAKGLEFPYVFIAGMEDGLFPGRAAMFDPSEIEEERRLAYVGITRAKKKLYLTCAESRKLYAEVDYNPQSRFISEIPDELIESEKDRNVGQNQYRISGYFGGSGRVGFDPGMRSGFAPGRNRPHIEAVKPKKGNENIQVDFAVGDRVQSQIFGDGTVVDFRKMGTDALIEVAFDTVGTKKLMAKIAKLKKI